MSETTTPQIRGLGHSVRRKEDDRLIRGRGHFVDDIALPGMLHMALLRAPIAHARITAVDVEAAKALKEGLNTKKRSRKKAVSATSRPASRSSTSALLPSSAFAGSGRPLPDMKCRFNAGRTWHRRCRRMLIKGRDQHGSSVSRAGASQCFHIE